MEKEEKVKEESGKKAEKQKKRDSFEDENPPKKNKKVNKANEFKNNRYITNFNCKNRKGKGMKVTNNITKPKLYL